MITSLGYYSSLGRMNDGKEGEKFPSNTPNIVEVSLLSSEAPTSEIEENVSSFMIQGLAPKIDNFMLLSMSLYLCTGVMQS